MNRPELSAEIIRQQIEAVKLALPDVFDDDEWTLSIESETDLNEYLRMIERKREDAAALGAAVGMTIDDLKARKARFERREQAMRHLMFTAMQWADLRKCELPEATLSVVNGKPRVVITDEAALPKECLRVKTEPDKVVIKTMLDNFEIVSGACLSNPEPHLNIRTK